MRTQEFQVSFDDFKDKLGDMEELAAKMEPVSAVYDTIKEQQKNDEVSSLLHCASEQYLLPQFIIKLDFV